MSVSPPLRLIVLAPMVRLVALMLCFVSLHVSASTNGVHTLDIVFSSEMPNISDPLSGKYAELKTLIDDTRRDNPVTFSIFGGGSIGPSAFSNLDRGSHIIDLLNTVEIDVMGIAKRDFTFLEDELSLRSLEAAFPMVSSNIIDTRINKSLDGLLADVIIRKGKVSLGIISIVDKRLVFEYLTRSIEVLPARETVLKRATKLRNDGADVVILHYFELDDYVDELLADGTIDLAFNSHTRLQTDQIQALAQNQRIIHTHAPGVAIVLRAEVGRSFNILQQRQIKLNTLTADPTTQTLVNAYRFRLDRILDERVGFWDGEFSTEREDVRSRENAFANFVADTMREFAKTDVALLNGGSIRGDRRYQKGDAITRRTIATELPFRSTVRVISITGKDLRLAFERSLAGRDEMQGTFLHVSGMKVYYDLSKPHGQRVTSIWVNNKALEEETIYSLATTDYLADGGDGYEEFTRARRKSERSIEETILVSDLVLREVYLSGKLSATIDQRLFDLAQENRE